MPKHTKLCHGDFCPSNIIVGDDGKWYLVDWVHASQGNASADVARTYLLLSLKDKKTADMYMDLFCEKTGTEKRYVQGWLPIVAAAFSGCHLEFVEKRAYDLNLNYFRKDGKLYVDCRRTLGLFLVFMP